MARKAACPDGEILIDLSHTRSRGLCTDGAPPWGDAAPIVTGTRELRSREQVGDQGLDWLRMG
jgi:hypothetical protein